MREIKIINMKEVCGYLGLDGKFYKEQKDCKESDLKFKVRHIEDKLDKFSSKIESMLLRKGNPDLMYEYTIHRTEVLRLVAETILKDSDLFVDIINEKKELEKELEELYRLTERKPWWMQIKWWTR